MKKYIIMIIITIVVIAGIVYHVSNDDGSVPNNNEMYIVKYTATVATENVLKKGTEYEIVKTPFRLNNIINNAKNNNYDNRFTKAFFDQMNLLVIPAGADTQIQKKDITTNSVNISIYHASLFTSQDEEYECDLYLIPVEKNIKEYSIHIEPYPDRMY